MKDDLAGSAPQRYLAMMFIPPFLRSSSVAIALILSSISAHAAVSPVSVRVEAVSATEPDKHTTLQRRSLKVFLTNGSGEDQTGLKLKYYYFTKSIKDRDTVMKETGEKSADVKARTTETIETPIIKASSTEAHSSGNPFNNRNNNNANNKQKKVEASGEKIVGHGVQLFSSDGKLMTEYFSEPSLKNLVGGGAK